MRLQSRTLFVSFGRGPRPCGAETPTQRALRLAMLVLLSLSASVLLGATPQDISLGDVLSSLKPPRPEIPPTFWERNGTVILVAALLLLAGITLCVWMITRPKPAPVVPWPVLARRELEPLARQREDGLVLSRASQILRHYLARGFGLPADEATTAEFYRLVLGSERFGPELSSQISAFLRECDLRKFAPAPPDKPLGVVDRCLSIVGQAEARLAEISRQTTPVPAGSTAASSPKAGGNGQLGP